MEFTSSRKCAHTPTNLLAQRLEGAKLARGVEYTLRYLTWCEKTSLVSAIHVLENLLLPADFSVLAVSLAHGRRQLLIVEKPFGKRHKLVDVAGNKSGPFVLH
jgi:hypothetical protein